MANPQTAPQRTPVRLRFNLATRTAEVLGQSDHATAVAAELKHHLGDLVAAQDLGDATALAEAVARVNALLDHVEIEWVQGGAR